MNKILICLASMSLFLLVACGGGGGGGSTGSPSGGGQTSTTSMKLTMALQGATAANVKGIQTTISLPPGVTLRAEASGKTLPGVVSTTGSATGAPEAKYTAATATSAATLTLGYITTSNLAAGDIFTIDADLAAGVATPAASAFTFSGTTLIDDKTIAVSGASLSIR